MAYQQPVPIKATKYNGFCNKTEVLYFRTIKEGLYFFGQILDYDKIQKHLLRHGWAEIKFDELIDVPLGWKGAWTITRESGDF